MLDFRSWLLFTEAPSDYTWVEKDPEDYEAELAAWKQSVLGKSGAARERAKQGEKPSPYKRVMADTIKGVMSSGSGSGSAKTKKKKRKKPEGTPEERAAAREISKIKSKEIARNPLVRYIKEIDDVFMTKLGLFKIENGKKVLAEKSLADMIMKICRKAKANLLRRGKEVDIDDIFSDTVSILHTAPKGILNDNSTIPENQFLKVKAMQNSDGTLPEDKYEKVMSMVGSQARNYSGYVGWEISMYGTRWRDRKNIESPDAIKFEPIATDKKTQRQKDIERDDRLALRSGIVGSPAERMLNIENDFPDFSKKLLAYFNGKDSNEMLLQMVRKLFDEMKKDAGNQKITNQDELQKIVDNAETLFVVNKEGTAKRVEKISRVQPETYKSERQKRLTRNLIGTSREPYTSVKIGGEEEDVFAEPDEKLEKNVLSVIDDYIKNSTVELTKEKWKKIKKVAFYVLDADHRWNKEKVAEFLKTSQSNAEIYIKEIRRIAQEVALDPKGLGLNEPQETEEIIKGGKIPLTPFQKSLAAGKPDPSLKRLVRHGVKGQKHYTLPGDFAQERKGTTPQQVARREISDQEKKEMADDILRKINKLYKLDQERIKKEQLPLFVVDQRVSNYGDSSATTIDPGEQHRSSVASIRLWKAQSELSYAQATKESYEKKIEEIEKQGANADIKLLSDLRNSRDEMKNQVDKLEKEIKELKSLTDKEVSVLGNIKRSELTDPVETPFLVKYDNDPDATPYASNKGMAGKKPLGRLKALRDILNKANDPRLDSEEVKRHFNAPLPRAMPGEKLQALPVSRWTRQGFTSNAYLTGLRPSQIGKLNDPSLEKEIYGSDHRRIDKELGYEGERHYVTGMPGMAPGEKYYPEPPVNPKSILRSSTPGLDYQVPWNTDYDDVPEIPGSREYMNWKRNLIKPEDKKVSGMNTLEPVAPPVAPVAPEAPVGAKKRGRGRPRKFESTYGNGWISLSEHMARRRFAF